MKLVLGLSPRQLVKSLLMGLLAAAWSVFINLINLWILTPFITDLAVLGILCVIVAACVWLFSVPRLYRRQAVIITLFGLMVGQGLAALVQMRSWPLIVLGIVALVVLTSWFGRLTLLTVVMSAAALAGLNGLLPLRDWAYLSHFNIVSDTSDPIDLRGLSITPFFVVQAGPTQRVVTLQDLHRGDTATFIDHAYRYIQVSAPSGRVQTGAAQPDTLSHLPQSDVSFISSPLAEPSWHVQNSQLTVSFLSFMSTQQYAALAPAFISMQPALQDNWAAVLAADDKGWRQAMTAMRVRPYATSLVIQHGVLQGTFEGRAIHVPVAADRVLAQGSFSGIDKHEILLEGTGLLQVVSLDKQPHVVSTYRPADQHWLSGQIFAGPIDASGRDAVFINSNGTAGEVAHIVGITHRNRWHVLYSAPNPHLQFLAAVQFRSGTLPQIFANDSSVLRPTAAVYLTSYAYLNGQLERNWRLGTEDVNHAVTATLVAGGPQDIVLAAGQRLIVLSGSTFPAVPVAATTWIVLLIAGFGWQYVRRRNDRG